MVLFYSHISGIDRETSGVFPFIIVPGNELRASAPQ